MQTRPMQTRRTDILIVGCGLAGCLLAVYLAKAGHRVSIYERRPDPRAKGYIGGRSINLAMSARGVSGLVGAGLDQRVMAHEAIPMRGRMIHPPLAKPELKFQPYSHDPNDAIYSVSRGGLNLMLLNAAAELPGVEFHFEHPCTDIDIDAPAGLFQTPSGESLRVEAKLIVGADGAFSPVRGRLQKTDRFEYSQTYLQHGYKELHIPSAAELGISTSFDGYALDPNALHIWPRGGAMMIALPNRDKSFTCTLFWPFEGEHGLNTLQTPEQVRAFFGTHYPDFVPISPTFADDYFRNPSSSLVTVRCWPWQYQGKVVILGDASHAIVPFYGQGMNAAFEDCKSLAGHLATNPDTVAGRTAALEAFQKERKPNADAIADMALENFVEMRDKVGSPAFLYRKRVEQALHHAMPDTVTPQYNLVSFSTVPYAQAQQAGTRVAALIDRVVESVPMGRATEMDDPAWRAAVLATAQSVLSGKASEAALIDITPELSAATNVWPGDTPLSREMLMDLAKGDTVTLSTLRGTVHLGAHADGSNHYAADGVGVGRMPLSHFIGPAQVVTARVERGARVQAADIDLASITALRVLIRTGTFNGFAAWNADFAGLSAELINALAARGVVTIGVDTPSVDTQNSKDLPAHKAIYRHNIGILEGLDLTQAPDGHYELLAQPLKLIDFDGSPVRAVLRPLNQA